MTEARRVVDYDRVAARYDRRYDIHQYAGVRETLFNFIGDAAAVLEVGCGTGHWLAAVTGMPSPRRPTIIAGVEPSAEMIARAHAAAPQAHVVRARAERLPWHDATFDRVCCINALHHFSDRQEFFAETRRVLKPGGALMSVGKDPHAERDTWWVYDFFPETVQVDRERFARVRTLRGELALAGFAWTESLETDRIEALTPADEALSNGIVDCAYTSQLAVLSDAEFQAGVERIRAANDAAGGALQLVTDFRLFATVGWV